MANTEQLPSGRWRGVAYHPVKVDSRGRKARYTQSFSTEPEAHAWAVQQEAEWDDAYRSHGVPVNRGTRRRSETLGDLIERYLRLPHLQPSTVRTYTRCGRDIAAFMGESPVAAIRRADCEDYLRDLQARGYGPYNLSVHWRLLKSLMAYAVKSSPPLRSDDPTFGVTPPRCNTELKMRWVSEQDAMLIGYFLPRLMWPMALMSYDTGMRWGELAGLQAHRLHIWEERPYVEVVSTLASSGARTLRQSTKGGRSRVIPIPRRTADALADHLTFHGPGAHDLVFTNGVHAPWHHSFWVDKWGKARSATGIEARFHDLRHSYISRLANDPKFPLLVVQKLAGHSSITTTQRYMHVSERRRTDDLIRALFDEGQDDDRLSVSTTP